MADLNTIFNWFKTGDFPTANQFRETFLSFRHKDSKIPMNEVEGLGDALGNFATSEMVSNAISQETDNRIAADNELAQAIQEEKQDRILADQDLESQLASEAQTRLDADLELEDNINTINTAIDKISRVKKQVTRIDVAVTHYFESSDLLVLCKDLVTNEYIDCRVIIIDDNSVQVNFLSAPVNQVEILIKAL